MRKRTVFILMMILVILSVVFYILPMPKSKGVPYEDKEFTIGYIPEGLTMEQDMNNVFGIDKYYVSESDNKNLSIIIKPMEIFGRSSVDTENAVINDITVNGYAGHTIEKYDNVMILWCDENTFYMVDGNIGKEECIKIAESISYEIKQ